MSKEKINKTDIQNAVTDAFNSAIREFRQKLTAQQVAEAFEGSGLKYQFDAESANITILVDGNSRIECVNYYNLYEIQPSMTYNSLTPLYRPPFDGAYRFWGYQLPSMMGFFRNLANRLIAVKKEFDSQTKDIIVGDVLKTMIKPLLRKEKIFKVKYRIGDDGGSLIMYKDFFDTLRLSATLTSDNYESRISEFGEANRAMSDIVDRDDAATFLGIISGVERDRNIEVVNTCANQQPYATEMRYPAGSKLLDFEKKENVKEEYAYLCRILDDLKYNWGWIKYDEWWTPGKLMQDLERVIVQVNNNLLFVIEAEFCPNTNPRVINYHIMLVRELGHNVQTHWCSLSKSQIFNILNFLATRVRAEELAEFSFSVGVVNKIILMIADHSLTFPHNCVYGAYDKPELYMGTKAKDCLFKFKTVGHDEFSLFNYLNKNYEDYLVLADVIVKYPEYLKKI